MKSLEFATTASSTRLSSALLEPALGRLMPASKPAAKPNLDAPIRSAVKPKNRIKVLLADDHPIVRRGIGSCLARHARLDIVGEAADGREALLKIRALLPDLVLLDIDMPHMSGLAVTDVLRKELPQIKVLILSMQQQSEYVLRILQSGAHGYVLKDSPIEEIIKAVEAIYDGHTFFSPEIARLALNQFVQGNGEGPDPQDVTPREREVLIKIAEGFSNKEIASDLGVGVRTVETHRERIMRKLNIHSIAGLTRFCISKGLTTLRDDIRR
jgi:two-component system, NarL family, nitrate/nitrite response regulator NarL